MIQAEKARHDHPFRGAVGYGHWRPCRRDPPRHPWEGRPHERLSLNFGEGLVRQPRLSYLGRSRSRGRIALVREALAAAHEANGCADE